MNLLVTSTLIGIIKTMLIEDVRFMNRVTDLSEENGSLHRHDRGPKQSQVITVAVYPATCILGGEAATCTPHFGGGVVELAQAHGHHHAYINVVVAVVIG